MTARPDGNEGGTIFCDVKTPDGTCKAEFESLPQEPYGFAMDRALDEGWRVKGWVHICPKHRGLWP